MSDQPGYYEYDLEGTPMEVDPVVPMEETLAQLVSLADGLSGAGINIQSRYNPDQLLNNCAIVTMAYLMGTDARTLLGRIGLSLDPACAGLSIQEILLALERIGDRFVAHNYSERLPDGGGPIRSRRGVHEALFARREIVPSRNVGVAYRRRDGSGHVVTVNNAGTEYRRYRDYQIRTAGEDVTREVRESRIYLMFYFERAEHEPMEVASGNSTTHGHDEL